MNVEFLVILAKRSNGGFPPLPAVLSAVDGADITVTHPLMSRRHCEIYADMG